MHVFDGRVACVWSVGCKCEHLIPCGRLFDTFHNWLWGKLRWFKCSLKESERVVCCCYCCCLQCMWDMRWRSWLGHCAKIRKVLKKCVCLFVCGATAPSGPGPPYSRGFCIKHNDSTQSVGLPMNDWSARRRVLYLTTHNTQNRQTSMPPVGFEPTISAGEWPQTNALDRAATGTGLKKWLPGIITGDKSGRCVGLTSLPPACAICLEIWAPQPPGTLGQCFSTFVRKRPGNFFL